MSVVLVSNTHRHMANNVKLLSSETHALFTPQTFLRKPAEWLLTATYQMPTLCLPRACCPLTMGLQQDLPPSPRSGQKVTGVWVSEWYVQQSRQSTVQLWKMAVDFNYDTAYQ